jgi:hypothetical protein
MKVQIMKIFNIQVFFFSVSCNILTQATLKPATFLLAAFFFIWFVKLLALRPLWPIVPASGDSEDDCGEADGM